MAVQREAAPLISGPRHRVSSAAASQGSATGCPHQRVPQQRWNDKWHRDEASGITPRNFEDDHVVV